MPELPEVNTVQKLFDLEALNRKILKVVVHDDKILRNLEAETFIEKLNNRTFTGTYRQGKFLFAGLDNQHHILLHLGMTGDIHYYSDLEERPRHERFHFYLSDGRYVGFNDPRKFARILYIQDLGEYLKEIKLGPDALRISKPDFLNLFRNRKTPLKAFLLNQSNVSGIGNLYADEICYQCRIHPASKIDKITKKLRIALHERMQSILQWACDQDAYYQIYPEDWFWKWRIAGSKGPNGIGEVHKATIAGRTTYYVEGWQRYYG